MTGTERFDMPRIGYGVQGCRGAAGAAAILEALALGYRHVDAGPAMHSQGEVGTALARSGLRREAVFVTARVGVSNLHRPAVKTAYLRDLERLGLDSVDLLLIDAAPENGGPVPFGQSLEVLAEIAGSGAAQRIGVANFSNDQMDLAEDVLGAGAVCAHAFDANVHDPHPDRVARCRRSGIATIATRPLDGGRLAADPFLTRVGAKYDMSAAQIALAALLSRGDCVVPGARATAHRAENLAAAGLRLDPLDLLLISALEHPARPEAPHGSYSNISLARALI